MIIVNYLGKHGSNMSELFKKIATHAKLIQLKLSFPLFLHYDLLL